MKANYFMKSSLALFFTLFFGLQIITAQDANKQQTIPSTVWNGTIWTNGLPDAQTKAIFTADFTSTQTLAVESVEVLPNAKVTFESGNNLLVTNEINVSPLGSLAFKVDANLSQKNPNVVNSTLLTLTRETPPITNSTTCIGHHLFLAKILGLYLLLR